jgi:DNA-binding SARP family transcriptional activator
MGTPPFRLRLLGATRVESAAGEPVELSGGKPLALLAYVCLAPEPPTRNELATLLWPGSPRKRARGSLRQALWQLRKTLGEELFEGDDPVSIREGHLRSDVALFRDHLAAGRLREALALWEGPPLPDLSLPDAPELERWSDSIRRELEERLGAALSERGRLDREAGSDEEAVHWLRMAREIQPDRLHHHLELAEAHLDRRAFDDASGALAEARRQFDDPAAVDRIRELEGRLHAVQRGTAGVAATQKASLRLRFSGRSEEFGTLARTWRQARTGTSRVALVSGEAGIGKTRLAEEVALLARSEGGRVVQVKAEDSERPIEWGLFGELVDRLLRLSGAAGISAGSTDVLRTVVPSIPQARGVGSGATPLLSRARPSAALADALQDLLAAVAEDAPLLVFVDDLQWADTESRSVLARVATRPGGIPIFFLVVSRSEADEIPPRVRKTLQLLSGAAGSVAIVLKPLAQDDMRDLLLDTLVVPDGMSAGPLVERIVRTSRGNPLFIVELLKVLQDHGIVQEEADGTLRLRDDRIPPDLPLPESLRELIERQLAHLPQDASLVAAHLAHARHAVPARMLASRAGLGPEALSAGVAELIHRRMVRWEAGEKLAFAHDELRAAVARRFQLHVGLTTGGGTHWSLFRTAVAASLVLLLVSALAYALSEGAFHSAPPVGGGPLLIVHGPDSVLEARAPVTSPTAGWQVQATPDPVLAGAALGSPPSAIRPPSARAGSRPARLPAVGDIRALEVEAQAGATGSVHLARVVRPDGSVVDRRGWERIHGAAWCGGTPPTLLLTVVEEGTSLLFRWDPDNGEVAALPVDGLPGAVLACSPDGRYGAVLAALGGEMRIQVLDLALGSATRLPVADAYGVQRLHWKADSPLPVPVRVSLEESSFRSLDWGERVPLDARVEYSDGSTARGQLVWTSRDPGVASVTSEGLLTANRPGETTIEVSFDGWLADSLRLQVRETSDNPRVLLWDRVPPLGDDLWIEREGAAPGSEGDGRTASTWYSSDGFSLPAGGTFEFEFILSSEGEPLRVCLLRDGSDGGVPVVPFRRPASRSSGQEPAALCLTLLDSTGERGDAELYFHPSFPPMGLAIPPPSLDRATRWRHAGLALLPDGIGVAYVDGVEVARTPVRLRLDQGPAWRVLLDGMEPMVEGAAGGRGFRNVLLWPDVRF